MVGGMSGEVRVWAKGVRMLGVREALTWKLLLRLLIRLLVG